MTGQRCGRAVMLCNAREQGPARRNSTTAMDAGEHEGGRGCEQSTRWSMCGTALERDDGAAARAGTSTKENSLV